MAVCMTSTFEQAWTSYVLSWPVPVQGEGEHSLIYHYYKLSPQAARDNRDCQINTQSLEDRAWTLTHGMVLMDRQPWAKAETNNLSFSTLASTCHSNGLVARRSRISTIYIDTGNTNTLKSTLSYKWILASLQLTNEHKERVTPMCVRMFDEWLLTDSAMTRNVNF